MDKSDGSKSVALSDDANENKQQTSSKFRSLNPEMKSHNMNDLKTLDFNSADEIRQTMKAVLAGNPNQHDPDDAIACAGINDTNPDTRCCPTSPIPYQMLHKTVQIEPKENTFQCIGPKNDRSFFGDGRRKRGRPPKAGTSKKLKKPSVSALYVGKLSNVVPFKRRRYASGSESEDLDSLLIMY